MKTFLLFLQVCYGYHLSKDPSSIYMFAGLRCACVCNLMIFFFLQIMKEIQEHKIKIYEFPDTEDDEDNKLIRKIKVRQQTVLLATLNMLRVLLTDLADLSLGQYPSSQQPPLQHLAPERIIIFRIIISQLHLSITL